ncbi:hypothetical protein OPQ81_006106 [Rhizoctonia solani]|nr:hypothetical protein OPQ81_006106 [Rhizoctonia solani]
MEMKASYIEPEDELFFDPGKQAERALHTLQLIIEYGGTLDRWRSLTVRSKAARPLYDVIGLINSASTPALRFLSLTWGADHQSRASPPSGVNLPAQQAMGDAEGKTCDSYALTPGPHRPQLAHIELVRLPSEFIFLRASPMVSNLTRFKLASPFLSLESVSNLLSGNPRLELLDVDIGTTSRWNSSERLDLASLGRLRVSLPLLSVFSLKLAQHQMCGLQLLKLIDAPNVESFELEFEIDHGDAGYVYDHRNWGIPTYLAKGRIHGALQSLTSPAENPGCGPIFPLVRKLNIDDIVSFDMFGQSQTFSQLLGAFPDITHLAAREQCIDAMLDDPDTHPNLRHITFQTPTYKDVHQSLEIMAEYALARQSVGLHISTLHIYTNTPDSFFKALKPKADNPNVIEAILGKEDWQIQDSIVLLYSSVETIIIRKAELRSPNWLMDSNYRGPAAVTGAENSHEMDSTEEAS